MGHRRPPRSGGPFSSGACCDGFWTSGLDLVLLQALPAPPGPCLAVRLLVLPDADGRHVLGLRSSVAESFLGLPAVDMYANEAAAQVKARLEALTRKDAVVDCCLQHYPEAGGAVKYRLFDTRMLPVWK